MLLYRPVLHRVVVVNVSLTVACCTKVTTEIATLIALTATAAAAAHQLTNSPAQQVKTYLKVKETEQRKKKREAERERAESRL